MTHTEFKQLEREKPCRQCHQLGVALRVNPNNGGQQVVCPQCGSGNPWGGGLFVSRKPRNKRERLPKNMSMANVWERYENRCVVCSRSKAELKANGVGQQRHHVLPHAQHGHNGPIVPICTQCHSFVTTLQRVLRQLTPTIGELDRVTDSDGQAA